MVHLGSLFAVALSGLLYTEALPLGLSLASISRVSSAPKGQSKALRDALPILEQLLRRQTSENATSANDYLEMLTTPTTEAYPAASLPASFASSDVVGMQVVTPGSTLFINDTGADRESNTVYIASEPFATQQPTQTVLSFYAIPTTTTNEPVDGTLASTSESVSGQSDGNDAVNGPVISNDVLDTLAGLANPLSSSESTATPTPTAPSVMDTVVSALPLLPSTFPMMTPVFSALTAVASDIPMAGSAAKLAQYLAQGTSTTATTDGVTKSVPDQTETLASPEAALLRSIVQAIQASQKLTALDNTQMATTTSAKAPAALSDASTPARRVQAARAERARARVLAQVKAAQLAQNTKSPAPESTSAQKKVTQILPGTFIDTAINFMKDKLQVKRSPAIVSDMVDKFADLLTGGLSTNDLTSSTSQVTTSSPQLTSLAATSAVPADLVNDVATLMADNNAAATALNGGNTMVSAVAAPASALSSLGTMLSPISNAVNTAVDAATDSTNTGTAAGGSSMGGLISAIPSVIGGITNMVKNTTLGKMLTS